MGLPVLRALSLCTCCRHYPGAATGRRRRSSRPAVSAFPENVVGSACTSSFSRLARRSLALRPAHSRSHLYVTSYTAGFSHFVTSMTAPVASGWSVRRVGSHPLESAAFSRRTREADIANRRWKSRPAAEFRSTATMFYCWRSLKHGALKRPTHRPRAENCPGLIRGVELLSSDNSTIIPLVGGILGWRSPWTPIPPRL